MSKNTVDIRRARTCYDHLAGRCGVAVTDALLAAGILDGAGALTEAGRARLTELSVDCTAAASKRPFVRYCVDWTERRPHLAGVLGARLLGRFEELDWIERRSGSRAVDVTDAGAQGLAAAFGIDTAGLAMAATII